MKPLKISITGPESAGKSSLAESLANHFKVPYAKEYAREFLEKTGGKYTLSDLDLICAGQVMNEDLALSKAHQLCFFDTDMLVLKVWAEVRFQVIPPFIRTQLAERKYDFFFVCKPDLPWEPDPFRESPSMEERMELFERYIYEVNLLKKPYAIIEGEGGDRQSKAIQIVSEKFSL